MTEKTTEYRGFEIQPYSMGGRPEWRQVRPNPFKNGVWFASEDEAKAAIDILKIVEDDPDKADEIFKVFSKIRPSKSQGVRV